MKVWVNGTFDVLHIGHLRLLKYASSLGKLRVGIDSDKRVKELKGNDRPFNNLEDRKEFLLSLKFVDEVVVFDSRKEMLKLIEEYEPHYMVVGGDYKGKEVIGSQLVKELIYFDRIENYSTSEILNFYNSNK